MTIIIASTVMGNSKSSVHTGTAAQYNEAELPGSPSVRGYRRPGLVSPQGTLSPAGLPAYSGIIIRLFGSYSDGSNSYISLEGWGADPGQSWLASITGNGVTTTGGAATAYTFGSTIALWRWAGVNFAFTNGGAITGIIVGS